MEVNKRMYNAIVNSAKGVAPPGIKQAVTAVSAASRVAKDVAKPRTYVSASPNRYQSGNTYRKVGPVSIIQKNATPATKRQAATARRKSIPKK